MNVVQLIPASSVQSVENLHLPQTGPVNVVPLIPENSVQIAVNQDSRRRGIPLRICKYNLKNAKRSHSCLAFFSGIRVSKSPFWNIPANRNELE